MTRRRNTLLKRQAALEKVMDRYRNLTFSWEHNRTCIHLLKTHLTALGYKLPKVPKLDGPLAAKRELKRHGWSSVEAMLDELLTPIPVAAMLPGDVSVMPSADGLGGVVISLGSTAIGYAAGAPGMVIFTTPGAVLERAWRV